MFTINNKTETKNNRPSEAFNNEEEDLKYFQKDSYLNIWTKIPSLKDINITLGIIKTVFFIGIQFMLGYLTYLLTNNSKLSIIIPIAFFF